MNKNQLAQALSSATKAPADITADFVDALFETIAAELERGQKVTLGNFGTFYLVRHKERATNHPTSKSAVALPPRSIAKFRPSQKLKQKISSIRHKTEQ